MKGIILLVSMVALYGLPQMTEGQLIKCPQCTYTEKPSPVEPTCLTGTFAKTDCVAADTKCKAVVTYDATNGKKVVRSCAVTCAASTTSPITYCEDASATPKDATTDAKTLADAAAAAAAAANPTKCYQCSYDSKATTGKECASSTPLATGLCDKAAAGFCKSEITWSTDKKTFSMSRSCATSCTASKTVKCCDTEKCNKDVFEGSGVGNVVASSVLIILTSFIVTFF